MPENNHYRLFDAAANRALEGVRVIEDYARFVLDDAHLTRCWKDLRHELAQAIDCVPMSDRCAARHTEQDVGTRISAADEYQRPDIAGLVAANVSRVGQALRSLEESAKLIDEDVAIRLESIRYQSYTLAAALQTTGDSIERLKEVRLCVLIDGCQSPDRFRNLVQAIVGARVGAIQLRDKQLDDHELLERACILREETASQGTLAIVNDRADLAVLADANGVHVGQTDLPVHEVRKIVGVERIVGVSTHDMDQARQAVLDGANYIGVGPTFASQTKSFDGFAGLEFLSQVAGEIRLPAFAIGGIDTSNLGEVVATGIDRIAVSAAVTTAVDSAVAVDQLTRILSTSTVTHAVTDIHAIDRGPYDGPFR